MLFTVSVPLFTCTAPVLVRLMLPATVLLPVLISVPALLMARLWQHPFQFRLVLPPSVSVPPATVLRLAAPPWLFWMSVASTDRLPAARSSRLWVRITLPVTVPVLSDPTTVTPLPPMVPPVQAIPAFIVTVPDPPRPPLFSVKSASMYEPVPDVGLRSSWPPVRLRSEKLTRLSSDVVPALPS